MWGLMSKSWQNFNFGVNYPFKAQSYKDDIYNNNNDNYNNDKIAACA